MADLTITETALADGRISYELGEPNWRDRRIPDLRSPGDTVQIAAARLIDVVILGDGYMKASEFRDGLAIWLKELYTIDVYERFAGCIRIRALYTPSTERASASRGSYYGCPIATGGGIDQDGDWWQASGARNDAFREALWGSVDTFDDVNLRRYPEDLTTGEQLVIDQDDLRGVYRNLVVSMLVYGGPSGFNRLVPRPAPDQDHNVKVAFGAFEIHEFSHALGMLHDEYIHHRTETVTYRDPVVPSVFSLSNVRFSDRLDEIPWLHLSPWGLERRSSGGQAPSPLVGWLWIGGGIGLLKEGSDEIGAWHSEYMCLMNGSHDNYEFTQEDSDPTNLADGSIEGAEPARQDPSVPLVPGARDDPPAGEDRPAARTRRPRRHHRTGRGLVHPLGARAPRQLSGALRRPRPDQQARGLLRDPRARARRRAALAIRPLLGTEGRTRRPPRRPRHRSPTMSSCS